MGPLSFYWWLSSLLMWSSLKTSLCEYYLSDLSYGTNYEMLRVDKMKAIKGHIYKDVDDMHSRKKIRWRDNIRLEKVVSNPNKFFKNFNSIIYTENFQPSVNSDKYPWIVIEKLKEVDSFNSSESDSNHHSGCNKEAKLNWQKKTIQNPLLLIPYFLQLITDSIVIKAIIRTSKT